MKILAIETSCDDTAVAVLQVSKTGSFEVLSNIIASQIEVHKPYGGVYPFLAKREHQKNLKPTLDVAIKEAEISQKDIDLIAVTRGPGLEPCLWVGVNFAKDLAEKWNKPLVPVNHIESHILVNFLDSSVHRTTELSKIFPAVCLVVSGGHTQLILMRGIGKYKILGETRDDAAGECFDKCAKILGLGYPGGPIISKLAEGIKPQNIFPRPMINTKDYDFSFSGLKTAVLYAWQKIDDRQKTVGSKITSEFAAEVQQAIIDVLLKKTIKAAKDFKVKTIILGGGVSANSEFRKQFKETLEESKYGFFAAAKNPYPINLLTPSPELSTDNGLMTAIAAYFHQKDKIPCEARAHTKIRAEANLRIN